MALPEPLFLEVWRPMKAVSWGAVMFGAVTGLAGALLVFVTLGIVGLRNDLRGQSVLIFLLYAAFLFAGYIAGRAAPALNVVHGGLAATVLFALQVVLAGARPVTIVIGGVIAAIIGSAGGALGQWSRERNTGASHDAG